MKTENNDILIKMNSFFERHEKFFLWASLFLGGIISIIMFDSKVSLSGDDCDYIVNAQDFIKHFTYPGGRGSLYPIVISPFLIGGLNLILLKSLSAVFILLSMWLMYKSFHNKVPAIILMPTLLITNICPYIFFYASYTYSEPFFMLTQSLFVYLFLKYFYDDQQTPSFSLKTDWKKYLYIGLCILAMGLTRTIGYAAAGVIILFFCFKKQWRNLIYSTSAIVILYVIFDIIKSLVWPESGAAYNINNYLAKNFYNIEQGMEDFPGFVDRLVVNSNVYLSGFFYQFLGIIPPSEAPLPGSPVLSIFTYLLFFVCLVVLFFKNKALFFIGLYVGAMNFASFILLQTLWAQDRLIMIYYPLMLLFVLGGIFYLTKDKLRNILRWIYPVILIILLFATSTHLKIKAEKNFTILQQTILGNDLYGLTPDWENFVKMSRWTNENLDKNVIIASRKPTISYIYTGRDFYGIYNVPNISIDDVIDNKIPEYSFLVVELQPNNDILDNLDPYMQYIFTTKGESSFFINNKKINNAISYKIEKSLVTDELITFFDENNINYTFDYDAFLKQYINDKSNGFQIVEPDALLKIIKDSNIRYFILAKIRIYTPENTGYFVNTIHQYINFIQLKYPGRFNLIHTIGKDESCELVEYIGE